MAVVRACPPTDSGPRAHTPLSSRTSGMPSRAATPTASNSSPARSPRGTQTSPLHAPSGLIAHPVISSNCAALMSNRSRITRRTLRSCLAPAHPCASARVPPGTPVGSPPGGGWVSSVAPAGGHPALRPVVLRSGVLHRADGGVGHVPAGAAGVELQPADAVGEVGLAVAEGAAEEDGGTVGAEAVDAAREPGPGEVGAGRLCAEL